MRVFVFILLFVFPIAGNAQKYFIQFKDKPNIEKFNPYTFFDSKAIERRIKHNLPVFDESDVPVYQSYVDDLSIHCDSITNVTRWFNGVFAYSREIEKIKNLPFVKDVYPVESYTRKTICALDPSAKFEHLEKLREQQLSLFEARYFEENHLTGKGVRIAIFDVGFPSVQEHPAFEHLRKENKIVGTYDFVRDREDPYTSHWHGTAVLSCIAGKMNGKNLGTAPDAEFLLARTESFIAEQLVEEENWLVAAEWADRNGADIINSSLGYTKHRYFRKDMNGETSLVAAAAKMAVRKGILVVNAAGNDGNSDWLLIGTPADVDSVLSVGGVDPETRVKVNFSSLGPNRKGIMKPNVCASGIVTAAKPKTYFETQGTSFASPLVAGFAACVLQKYPELTNMQLFDSIQYAAQLFPYFDYAHGFGIPKASYFFEKKHSEYDFIITSDENYVKIVINQPLPEDFPYVFYKIQDSEGNIKDYFVVKADVNQIIDIPKNYLKSGEELVVWANGKMKVLQIP